MPRYTFKCECGEIVEVIRPMKGASDPWFCLCGEQMTRDYAADHINGGNKDYARPIHSDSLAITPGQVAEHQRLFPDVEIDSECRPVFNNYQQHNKYLEKTGFVKNPKKAKRRGKRIAQTL